MTGNIYTKADMSRNVIFLKFIFTHFGMQNNLNFKHQLNKLFQ